MIVCDSSPLIHLTKIGKIEFLIQMFPNLAISRAVYHEVVEKGLEKGELDANIIKDAVEAGRIQVIDLEGEDSSLIKVLHAGERETLQIAQERGALAIIDERKARLIAEQRKIPFHGTLGVLLMLLQDARIEKDQYLRNLKKFAVRGRISIQLYEQYRSLGEDHE
ncbi:MAG: hypothetical protein ACTSU5_11195 [Promethearchaeota archaeon]